MAVKYEEFLQKKLAETSFYDAFDIHELQELQDVLASALELASVITDTNQQSITEQSNCCRLCREFVLDADEVKWCVYSDVVKEGASVADYRISRCSSTGLFIASVPLLLGEKHIADWIFGQVRMENEGLDLTVLEEKTKALGTDWEEFLKAYEEVPVMPRERFENIAKLVHKISIQISEQTYQKCVRQADEEYRVLLEDEMNQQKIIAEYNSTIDELTQLNNRNYFESKMEQLDVLGITPVALIAGDVNHLKLTNDIFGHRHGDVMLHQIAEVMLDEAFDDYIICRCGGDEFNVIIPNANRQDAEWYCKRVRRELKKKFNCCFMPSIAFGVAKKSHPQERLKDIMEFADYKMYRDKIAIKEKEDLLASITDSMIGRGFLTLKFQECSIKMARRFGKFLQWDEPEIKRLTRVVRIQDYGLIVLNKDIFEMRLEAFYKKIPLEAFREISKHPVAGSRIAKVNEHYAELSEDVLCHEENWDGTGYPNELRGGQITLRGRLGRIIGDYNTLIAEAPQGLGMSVQEARKRLKEKSGTWYDPEWVEKFLEFLDQDVSIG